MTQTFAPEFGAHGLTLLGGEVLYENILRKPSSLNTGGEW